MSKPVTHQPPASATERARVLGLYHQHLSVGNARLAELMRADVEARSEGPYIWDAQGDRYLNCGGYGVFLLGHCHPRVVEAVVEQVRTHPTTSYFLLNRAEAEAAAALARVAPPGLDHVFFALSGAEAVEAALKLARLNGRRRVIAMENGYHGMTMGALSLMDYPIYRQPFEPLLSDVEFVPFGHIDALLEALQRGPEACVVLEPIQGEAGVLIPPNGYLHDVEHACRAHGAFLVVDEIQTGTGRLGTWWAVNRESVTPDLILAGKALSGGIVPVSAVIGSQLAFDRLSRNPLLHDSTFSGAPIAMAAVAATIRVIEEEDILGRAARLGEGLLDMTSRVVRETCPTLVTEVRGVGLLIAIEWKRDHLALDFLIEMLDRRVVLTHAMNAPRVTRLTPPAILTDVDVDTLEAAMRGSAAALMARV
jgi:putrescine aminotransferase